MQILVLGGNGFIGSTVVARLVSDDHGVIGLGRNPDRAARTFPEVGWVRGDLARLQQAGDWSTLLEDVDVVVNCAGALQDGLADDLTATQERSMLALYEAARSRPGILIVQISAPMSGDQADVLFLETKRRADSALASSGVRHVILRPTLVLGRNAHGGSALLRALASIPYVIPLIHADSSVQTVSADDVAAAVADAVAGRIPDGSDMVLSAQGEATLRDVIIHHRRWLGLPPARIIPAAPWLTLPVTWMADVAGRLGWRSPLRSTAMRVMAGGVSGTQDGAAYARKLSSMRETLAANPAGVQDLWFARLYLLKPITIVCLSMFWMLSGLIPLLDPTRSATPFLPFMSPSWAWWVTLLTCAADVALGLSVLVRPFARRALQGMIALTLSYLVGGTILQPELWIDPLGPLVKVFPAMILTLVALASLDER